MITFLPQYTDMERTPAMKHTKCPGAAEQYMRTRCPNIPGRSELDLSDGDIISYVVIASGELACSKEGCNFEYLGGTCVAATVCVRDKNMPELGESVSCQFAAVCDFTAEADPIGKERRNNGCIARVEVK